MSSVSMDLEIVTSVKSYLGYVNQGLSLWVYKQERSAVSDFTKDMLGIFIDHFAYEKSMKLKKLISLMHILF